MQNTILDNYPDFTKMKDFDQKSTLSLWGLKCLIYRRSVI